MQRLYLDLETSSGDPKQLSVNPWKYCTFIGAAYTWDDHPEVYWTKDLDIVQQLLLDCKVWVNHNIKYDMHVLDLAGVSIPQQCELYDTLTMAKLIDSERMFRGGYGLDALAVAWLGRSGDWDKKLLPYLINCKDYGNIPEDILSTYAKEDVTVNRLLDKFIMKRLPAALYAVKDLEKRTTRALFNMEKRGFYVSDDDLYSSIIDVQQQMLTILQQLYDEYGMWIEPHVPSDCKKLLVDLLSLPILGWTKARKPSFSKKTLLLYSHPIVQTLLLYRKLATFKSGFIQPSLRYRGADCIIHSFYTQLVRTGRMSCKSPNIQAMSKLVKKLIKLKWRFFVFDYSQIEFRIICHICNEVDAIKAYNSDPDTDFHRYVAKLAGIERSPAKTLNFGVAYGQGEASTISMLMQHGVDRERAIAMRQHYFANFARIVPTSRQMMYDCKLQGYTENLYMRRRHLDASNAYKAFNTVVQGTAADIMKEGLCKVSEAGYNVIAVVHDEIVIDSLDCDTREVKQLLEHPSIHLSVPITASVGNSDVSWFDGKV